MPKKTLKGTWGGHGAHLAWGGSHHTIADEVLISSREDITSGNYVNGPALRDALIEAFPLPAEAKTAEPEPPFKVGDRVRFLEEGLSFRVGDEATVVRYDPEYATSAGGMVTLDSPYPGFTSFGKRLKKVQPHDDLIAAVEDFAARLKTITA